jgi:hypothetical protein
MPHRTLFKLALLATVFGIGHHIDHVIRGNHVGWPLIEEPTPFTYSLGFYPFIASGLYFSPFRVLTDCVKLLHKRDIGYVVAGDGA